MTEVSQNTSLNDSGEKLSLVDKYFSLKKEQRINRKQFLVRIILLSIIIVLVGGIYWELIMRFSLGALVGSVSDKQNYPFANLVPFLYILTPILFIVMPYFIIVTYIKRVHDFNISSYMYFGGLILSGIIIGIFFSRLPDDNPSILDMIGFIFVCILFFLPSLLSLFVKGNPGSNKYGPVPTGKPLV